MSGSRRWAGIVGLVLCGMVACEPAPAPELSKADRALVDSLYNAAQTRYRLRADSLCKAQKRVWIREFSDSMKQERLLEISRMLDQ